MEDKMGDGRRSEETKIVFDENNIPVSLEYDDPFYSKADGFLETEAVFLKPCNIPEAFTQKNGFVIAETGFGTGLNFLVTLKKWIETPNKRGVLHFISFEKHIMPLEIARAAHSNWPEIDELSRKLTAKFPKAMKGVQRIWFDEYNVALTLVVGDIDDTIKEMNFKADAWFLDGFAPARNPKMWSMHLFNEIRRLSKPDVKIGTYSVARIIRDNLDAAGFKHAKREGFANKRERLEAWLEGEEEPEKSIQKVAIIGGGIAGACLYNAFKKRGINADVFDDDPEHIAKASGNYAGLIMPRIDRQPTTQACFFTNSFIYAHFFYQNMPEEAFVPLEINEYPKAERDFQKLEMFKGLPPLPDDVLGFGDDYFIHRAGGKIMPQKILKELFQDAVIINKKINHIEFDNDKYTLSSSDEKYQNYDYVIIANGTGVNEFDSIEFPVGGKAGVVSISPHNYEITIPKAGKGYCLEHEGNTIFGATFDAIELGDGPEITNTHHQRNHRVLSEFAPELAEKIGFNDLKGRASVRVVSKDKLPIAGQIDGGIYALGALGSRGFSTAPILAETIVSEIVEEPVPFFKEIRALTEAHRFKVQ